MVLEHAPVTGLSLFISAITAAVTGERYTRPPHLVSAAYAARRTASSTIASAGATGLFAHIRRAAIESVPLGGLGATLGDMFLTSSLLFQLRALERRWGSGRYLAFLVTAAVTGVVALHVLWSPGAAAVGAGGEAGSAASRLLADYVAASAAAARPSLYFTTEAVRVLTGAASLVPLTALVTSYIAEVPSTAPDRRLAIPCTAIVINDKVTLVVPLLKVILSPNGLLRAPTHKRDGVAVSVGVWTRLLLGFIGIVFALASTRAVWLRRWLSFLSKRVYGPLLGALRPLLIAPLFGDVKVVTHAVPPHMQQQQQQQQQRQHGHHGGVGRQDGAVQPAARYHAPGFAAGSEDREAVAAADEGGRIHVDSLSGARGLDRAPLARGPRRPAAAAAASARIAPLPPTAQESEVVARFHEMGLVNSEREIVDALRACGGDASAAANRLLSS